MVKIDGGRRSINSLNLRLWNVDSNHCGYKGRSIGWRRIQRYEMKTKLEEEKNEMMQQAIKQSIESEGEKSSPTRSSSLLESSAAMDGEDDRITDDRRRHLLSRLLSQLEALEGDQDHSVDVEKAHRGEKSEAGSCASNEEIAKELKAVKKQNFVTHCLLSALIVLTLAWQVSEVSLILKIKDGFNNPFRSIGSIVAWMFRRGTNGNRVQEAMNHVYREGPKQASFPGLKIPGPIEDLLGMDSSEEDE